MGCCQSGVLWTVVSKEFKVATFLTSAFVTGPVVRMNLKLVLWGEMHHGGNREGGEVFFETG